MCCQILWMFTLTKLSVRTTEKLLPLCFFWLFSNLTLNVCYVDIFRLQTVCILIPTKSKKNA